MRRFSGDTGEPTDGITAGSDMDGDPPFREAPRNVREDAYSLGCRITDPSSGFESHVVLKSPKSCDKLARSTRRMHQTIHQEFIPSWPLDLPLLLLCFFTHSRSSLSNSTMARSEGSMQYALRDTCQTGPWSSRPPLPLP